jgi:hypothetical protein
MIYMLAADDSLLNPALFRDWGTAGILLFLIVLFGLALWWAIPKFVIITINLNGAFESAKELKKDMERHLARVDAQATRLEVVVAKLKSRQYSEHERDPLHDT